MGKIERVAAHDETCMRECLCSSRKHLVCIFVVVVVVEVEVVVEVVVAVVVVVVVSALVYCIIISLGSACPLEPP